MQTLRSFLADISPHSPLSGTGMKQLWILDALEICSLKILSKNIISSYIHLRNGQVVNPFCFSTAV